MANMLKGVPGAPPTPMIDLNAIYLAVRKRFEEHQQAVMLSMG